MALTSNFFRDNQRLQSCLTDDRAHITRGSVGQHVRLIQEALEMIDGLVIDASERVEMKYGDSTAAAVLAYKRKRTIINRSYQQAEDDIVGKMTIAALDEEMNALEGPFQLARARSTVCQQDRNARSPIRRAPNLPRQVGIDIAKKAFDPNSKLV